MPAVLTAKIGPPPAPGGTAPRCASLCAGIVAVMVWLCTLPLALGQQPLSDQQMKAAYVLNFIRYTDWPERSFTTPDAALAVCVLGDAGVATLAGMSGRIIRGHPVQVRAAASADDARACHVLFIPETDARRFVGVLRALQTLPVLTVSDADGFIDVGGMIGLVHVDNRLQFEINLGIVQQARLKASSQLLRLARNVIEARPR